MLLLHNYYFTMFLILGYYYFLFVYHTMLHYSFKLGFCNIYIVFRYYSILAYARNFVLNVALSLGKSTFT